MRKNSVRKWLHAILDLLPLLVIPIFAINIINRSPDPISAETDNYKKVNFNQLVQNGNFVDNSNWFLSGYTGNPSFTANDNVLSIRNFQPNYTNNGVRQNTSDFVSGHKYYYKFYITNYSTDNARFRYGQPYGSFGDLIVSSNSSKLVEGILDIVSLTGNGMNTINIGLYSVINALYDFDISNFNIYDLTKAFGLGNEPTIDEFNSLYPELYYDYTLSRIEYVDNGLITYNDTDIGSQFVYSLYNTTDKYFNMGNIFGVDGFYTWLNTNLFNGGAPLMIKTIWTIIVYEFIMDLMFLFYDIFMFLIDWIKALLGRAIDKTSGGAC